MMMANVKNSTRYPGVGVFASKDLPKGYRFKPEVPFATATPLYPYRCVVWALIDDLLRRKVDVNVLDVYASTFPLRTRVGYIRSEWHHLRKTYKLQREDKAIWMRRAAIMATNAYAFPDNAQFAFYKVLSRYNHACDPNARIVFLDHKGTVCVVLLKPIRAGEEITVSYDLNLHPERVDVTVRRSRLKSQHGFICVCSSCTHQ